MYHGSPWSWTPVALVTSLMGAWRSSVPLANFIFIFWAQLE